MATAGFTRDSDPTGEAQKYFARVRLMLLLLLLLLESHAADYGRLCLALVDSLEGEAVSRNFEAVRASGGAGPDCPASSRQSRAA